MKVYLIQHGLAKSSEENPERPLSQRGVDESKNMAAHLASLDIGPEKIFHSTKLRAQETAQIFAGKPQGQALAVERDGLAPKDGPDIWKERLESEEKDVMIVGHLPHLARLASLLLCGDSDKEIIRFRNSGVLCLEKADNGPWQLEWFVVPHMWKNKQP